MKIQCRNLWVQSDMLRCSWTRLIPTCGCSFTLYPYCSLAPDSACLCFTHDSTGVFHVHLSLSESSASLVSAPSHLEEISIWWQLFLQNMSFGPDHFCLENSLSGLSFFKILQWMKDILSFLWRRFIFFTGNCYLYSHTFNVVSFVLRKWF